MPIPLGRGCAMHNRAWHCRRTPRLVPPGPVDAHVLHFQWIQHRRCYRPMFLDAEPGFCRRICLTSGKDLPQSASTTGVPELPLGRRACHQSGISAARSESQLEVSPTKAVGCTLAAGGEGKILENTPIERRVSRRPELGAGWGRRVPCGVAPGREVGRPVRREVVLLVPVRSAEGGREPIGVARHLRGSWI